MSTKDPLTSINYVIDSSYFSGIIREYDIRKANISILYTKGCLSKDEYVKLYNADRLERQIFIGKLIRNNKDIGIILKDGLMEYKQLFYSNNDIKDENIISIHNDAIFVQGILPRNTIFDNIEFVYKNTYTSFYRVSGMELYYFLDVVNEIEKLDVKGIVDEKLRLHDGYFGEFLCTLFYVMQLESIENAISVLKLFTQRYLNRDLDIGYYREFNQYSCFRFGDRWMSDGADEKYISEVNITNNLYILRQLLKILSELYFAKV